MTNTSSRRAITLLGVLVLAFALLTPGTASSAPAVNTVAVTSAVEPAVARIDVTIPSQRAIGAGTGVVLDGGGTVLTNFHVVNGARDINVNVGGQTYGADLVGYSRRNDVAVVQLRGASGLPVAPIGDASQLQLGEQVVALGNAGGSQNPLTRETGNVTNFGRSISAQDELTGSAEQLTDLIEFSAPVRAGDSGGPVVDDSNSIVGVTTAATVTYKMQAAGQGFAIPIGRATSIADQIRSGVRSDTVHIGPPVLLGVGVVTASRGGATGVLASEVLVGGAADRAGIRPGDVVTTIGGVPIDSANRLTELLDQRYPGDPVDVTWIARDGQQRSGTATLAPA